MSNPAMHALEALGVSDAEEQAYRWLLRHPGATAAEMVDGLGLSARKMQRIVDALETKGLATHAPERPRRYIAASPDIAVEALLLKRQEGLKRARHAIEDLRTLAATVRRGSPSQPMVELLTSSESARQTFEQFHLSAREEIVSLVRPPVLISRLDMPSEEDQHSQRDAQTRGVRYRSIVDAEFLKIPGAIARMQSDMRAGEEIRMVPTLPFKMGLADRRIALIPMILQQSGSPVLLVRSSALLDALHALFEMIWDRAIPLPTKLDVNEWEALTKMVSNPDEQFAGYEELIALMSAGLRDDVIADHLKLSLRTFHRRVAELIELLGAGSRFQAGWQAALKFSRPDR